MACLIVKISCISNVKKQYFDLVLSITQKMRIENSISLPSAYFVLGGCVTIKWPHIPPTSSLEYIRFSSMVAPPPKPEDVPEDVPEVDVPEDVDGVDEETEERQEAIRYNRILLQGSFLFFFLKKVLLLFAPHLLTLTFSERGDRQGNRRCFG